MVLFFFLFASLFLNEQIQALTGPEAKSISLILALPLVAMAFFSIFFIHYANQLFMKKRKKELGLFVSLGMTNRDVFKLVLIEHALVAVASIMTGLLLGTATAYLFFVSFIQMTKMEDVFFQLQPSMYLTALIVYLVIFSLAVTSSLYFIAKKNIIEHLRSDQIKESHVFRSPALGALGFVFIVISIVGMYGVYASGVGDFIYLWAMLTFIGLYLVFNQVMSLVIRFSKKNNDFYYKRLMMISSLDYKFKQLTSVMMLVSMMIMITVIYSTVMLSQAKMNETNHFELNPFDIAFTYQGSPPHDWLYGLIEGEQNEVTEHESVSVFTYEKLSSQWIDTFRFMKESDFYQLTGIKLDLEEHAYVLFVNDQIDLNQEDINFQGDFTMEGDGENFQFVKQDEYAGRVLNFFYELYVVNEKTFNELVRGFDGEVVHVHMLNVDDWQETAVGAKQLEAHLEKRRQNGEPSELSDRSNSDLYMIQAKSINDTSTTDQLTFMVVACLSVIFFIASFMLLYLNILYEADREKNKYEKLKLVGMTGTELKRAVRSELRIIFFTPTAVGLILAFLYVTAMVYDMGGFFRTPIVSSYFFAISFGYLAVQYLFYINVKRKLYRVLVG